MPRLEIYRVEDRYIRFLHSRDEKVQDNKDRRRPYVGVVLTVGSFQYFVPMESPKPNHAKLHSGKHLLKLDGGKLGLLGFNNMIPVHPSALIRFDIGNEPDEKYRLLLQRQAVICNQIRSDVIDHAYRTYMDVTSGKNKFLIGISCDFKKLEAACRQYSPDYIRRSSTRKENNR